MEAKDIKEKLDKMLENEIKVYPCHNLRASNLGHPCERYLYLLITQWQEQKAHDKGLQSIFDLGNTIEEFAINQLKKAGFEVITPVERSWKIEVTNGIISGREDVRIKDENGELIPVEIKGLSSQEFEKLNTIEDFMFSKKHYVRAYPTQLFVYLYKFEKPYGFFVIVNKQTGEIKPIKMDFNFEFGEECLSKAERVYKAIEEKSIPEPICDPSVCEKCSLQHICGACQRVATDIELDDELEELIDRQAELKPYVSEMEEVKDQIKKKIGERERVLTGKYLIERKAFEKKSYTVQARTEYRLNIKKLG